MAGILEGRASRRVHSALRQLRTPPCFATRDPARLRHPSSVRLCPGLRRRSPHDQSDPEALVARRRCRERPRRPLRRHPPAPAWRSPRRSAAEDCQVQSMPDASPTKWHLAHITWFFETFVLERFEPGFRPFDPAFRVLFNSYYEGVGEQYPRAAARPADAADARPRCSATAPTSTSACWRCSRAAGDDAEIAALVDARPAPRAAAPGADAHRHQARARLQPGCARPTRRRWPMTPVQPQPMRWFGHEGGLVELGHDPARDGDFCFDNETPRHRAFVEPFELASRPVTNGEYLAFIDDGGYARPELWLSTGWDWVAGRTARRRRSTGSATAARWLQPHAAGRGRDRPAHAGLPRQLLRGRRLRALGRRAAADRGRVGARGARTARAAARQLRRPRRLPSAAADGAGRRRAGADVRRRLGVDRSRPTSPYPGFRPLPGAVGEYNGKFMCNQIVLRGGSCATPPGHVRASYRNFFPPDARWQFSGVRLARDA